MVEDFGSINFDNVVATADKGFTRPGTIDEFEITKIDLGKSKTKQTLGLTVRFENDNSGFSHTFYLKGSDDTKTKTLLGRVQALLQYIGGEGNKLSGQVNLAQFNAKMLKKKLALKVTGEVSNTGKGFATLGFSGFGKPANELKFLKFTAEEEKAIDKALEAIESSRSNNSDSEVSSNTSAPIEDFSVADPGVATENF